MTAVALTYQPFSGLTGAKDLEEAWKVLSDELQHYLDKETIAEILKTAVYGARAHEGQMRQSGEPYFTHPMLVAKILATQRFDLPVIQAALLHDVLEDTSVSRQEMEEAFGEEVTAIVDGVSKLERLKDQAPQEAQADSFKKMLVATTDDPRVIIIKLADRLHNMQTLGALRPDKRVRKAKETLDVYASIAGRLGLFYFRMQLEDLAFSHLYPWRYAVLKKHYLARKTEQHVLKRVRRDLLPDFKEKNIRASITSRQRHLWGIYQRMRRKESFNAACRTIPVRIICDSEDDCYRILGVLHAHYRPISGKFEDYIAAPKSNGYRSLHSSVLMPTRDVLNVQIRTRDMHNLAETGIIAVWHQHLKNRSLKQERHAIEAEKYMRDWLSRLREVQNITDDPLEFYDAVKKELSGGDIHVYTPKGEVIDLPKGATPVDFAYAIHTDIGNHCVGAKVNGLPYAIFRPLQVAQTVEIVTDKNAHPHAAWLHFVATAKARAAINHYLRSLAAREAEDLGAQLLANAFQELGASSEMVHSSAMQKYLQEIGLDLSRLFGEIARGKRQAAVVAAAVLGQVEPEKSQSEVLYIYSALDSGVHLASCCHPLYNDPIMAYLDKKQGILVHRENCARADVGDGEDCLKVAWAEHVQGVFLALIGIELNHRPGMLSAISDAISENGNNISEIQSERLQYHQSNRYLKILIEVKNRNDLARLIRRLRTISGVERIERL